MALRNGIVRTLAVIICGMLGALMACELAAPNVCHAATHTRVAARCGGCGRSVPTSSRAGMRCPHCGARWGRENVSTIGSRPPMMPIPRVPVPPVPRIPVPGVPFPRVAPPAPRGPSPVAKIAAKLDWSAMTPSQKFSAKCGLQGLERDMRLGQIGGAHWRMVCEGLAKLPLKQTKEEKAREESMSD